MLRSSIMFCLLAGAISLTGGCCCLDSMFACGGGGKIIADDCDACAGVGCRRCFRPLERIREARCSRGCGEVYKGEWRSDPPDWLDPCDDCGNWIGRRPWCPPGLLARFRNLWGRQDRTYRGPCCDSCGDKVVYDGPVYEGPIYEGQVIEEMEPGVTQKEVVPRQVIRTRSATQPSSRPYYQSHSHGARSVVE